MFVFIQINLRMNDGNITWNGFTRHITKMLQHMLDSAEYSDVTLVCEDDVKLKAHKVVLGSCSPLLKAKIDEIRTGEVEIDMKEIKHTEMKLILEFMYMGKAAIQGKRSNNFLHAARVLKLRDIGQDDSVLKQDGHGVQQEINFNKDIRAK